MHWPRPPEFSAITEEGRIKHLLKKSACRRFGVRHDAAGLAPPPAMDRGPNVVFKNNINL